MSIHYSSGQKPLAVHDDRSLDPLRCVHPMLSAECHWKLRSMPAISTPANHIAVFIKPTPVQLVKVDYPKEVPPLFAKPT